MMERLASVTIGALVVFFLALPTAMAQVPHPFVENGLTDPAGPPVIQPQVPDDDPWLPSESPVEVDPMASPLREAAEALNGVDLPGDLGRKVGLGGAGWPVRMNSPVPISPLLHEPSVPNRSAVGASDSWSLVGPVIEETEDEVFLSTSEPTPAADPPMTLPSPDPALPQDPLRPSVAQPATAAHPSEPWPLVVAGAFSILVLAWWLHHLFAGLSRIRAARILDNPQRQALYEYVCLNPGLGQKEVATAMGRNRSTINHHFQMLERSGYVITMRDGRRTLYFDGKKAMSGSQRLATAVLRNASSKAIAQHVETHPGITQRSLSKAFGVSASTIIWHTSRLGDAGLLHSKREGRYRRFFAGP